MVVIVAIVVINIVNNRLAPQSHYLLWSFASSVVLIAIGLLVGNSFTDMGLGWWFYLSGFIWAAVSIGVVTAFYVVVSLFKKTRQAFKDASIGSLSAGKLAFQALVEVPFGTVLLEEIAFRAVLFSMLARRFGVVWAIVISSLMFGIWHVLPSIGTHERNPALGSVVGKGLRANILTEGRADCTTCFSAQALEPGVITDAAYQFYTKQNKAATQSAAFLYLELGGSPDLAKSFSETAESVGFQVKILKGIGTAEFNYAPFVQEMKDKDIRFVSFTGATIQAVRLADAMAQQNFEPDQFVVTQTQYGPEFHEQGGANVDGAMAPVPHPAFNSGNPEITQYVQWLQRVKPGASPSTFGLFAWSAARLFAERAVALGGKLSRETLLAEIRKVGSWTAGGMHAEMNVGGKKSFPCQTVVQLQQGEWQQISGKGYTCGNLVRTSVAR